MRSLTNGWLWTRCLSAGGFGQRNRFVGDGGQKSVVAFGKPGDESFAATTVFSDRES